MRYLFAAAVLSLVFVAGCAWPANSGSQPVTINPFDYGNMVTPAYGSGYMDGQPLDMRTKQR